VTREHLVERASSSGREVGVGLGAAGDELWSVRQHKVLELVLVDRDNGRDGATEGSATNPR